MTHENVVSRAVHPRSTQWERRNSYIISGVRGIIARSHCVLLVVLYQQWCVLVLVVLQLVLVLLLLVVLVVVVLVQLLLVRVVLAPVVLVVVVVLLLLVVVPVMLVVLVQVLAPLIFPFHLLTTSGSSTAVAADARP
jgi:hypothetical protein